MPILVIFQVSSWIYTYGNVLIGKAHRDLKTTEWQQNGERAILGAESAKSSTNEAQSLRLISYHSNPSYIYIVPFHLS